MLKDLKENMEIMSEHIGILTGEMEATKMKINFKTKILIC